MYSGLCLPDRYEASPCTAAGGRLNMVAWASFTRNADAPASAAPSIAAFTSARSSRRPTSYSGLGPSTWLQSTIPAVPSMSVERYTLAALHSRSSPTRATASISTSMPSNRKPPATIAVEAG